MSRGQRLALNGPRCSVGLGGWLAVCIQNTGTLVEFGTVWFLRYTRGGGQTEHWDDTASVPRYITFPIPRPLTSLVYQGHCLVPAPGLSSGRFGVAFQYFASLA